MDPCAVNLAASALACALAEGKSREQLAVLSALLTQVGDSLATMLAAMDCGGSATGDSGSSLPGTAGASGPAYGAYTDNI